jgi:hypothetical protein
MIKINFWTKSKRIKLYRQLFKKFAEKYSLDYIQGDDYKCSYDRLMEKNGDFCMSLSDGNLIFPRWMIVTSMFGKPVRPSLDYTISTTKITDEEKIEQFLIKTRLEKKKLQIGLKKLKLEKDFN